MLSKIPLATLRIIQITGARGTPSKLFEKRNTLLEMLVDSRTRRGTLSNNDAFEFSNSFDVVCEIVAKFYWQISLRAEVRKFYTFANKKKKKKERREEGKRGILLRTIFREIFLPREWHARHSLRSMFIFRHLTEQLIVVCDNF